MRLDRRLELLRLMLLHRGIEDRVMALYRQGRIAGSVYTGRGQEAVAAAAGLALAPHDVVAPLNRELACHLARGVTVADVFRNYLGRGDGPTRGRDGNLHFGAPAHGVFPLVSMLGNLCPVVVGAALAFKRRRERRVAMTFLGDGALSTGDAHEGLNLAGVLRVPAVFVFQANGFAYSTPTERQMVVTDISARVRDGWGIDCRPVDGTDALATHAAIAGAVEAAREHCEPRAIEARTLRMHGHAAHDDARYVDPDIRALWELRDPIERLRRRLRGDGVGEQDLDALARRAATEVEAGLEEAQAAPAPDARLLTDGIYAEPLDGRSSDA